jgi:hypothetical protein
VHHVRARNLATASTNKIHEDATARQYGFAGGLVPGVDVYGYATHVTIEHFGAEWLRDGAARVRFHQPVYDGRAITVAGSDDGAGELTIVVRDGDTECARASARRGAGPAPDASEFPEAPLPDPAPPASAARFESVDVLGTITSTFDASRAGPYLDALGETLPVYRDRAIAHPAWLLRRANRILARNVTLGPWIHVESDVAYFALVPDGTTVSTRGRVERVWEHRGHEFVTIAVAMFTRPDVRPVMRATHTAIYAPRPRTDDLVK